MEAYWQRALRQRRKRPQLFLWAGLTLIAGGFAALALLIAPGRRADAELPHELADEPDAYLRNGVITQYREDGSLHYRLTAEQVSYFNRSDGDFTRLSAIVLHLPSATSPPWRLEAERGRVRSVPAADQADNVEEEVTLLGDVTLRQDRGDSRFTAVYSDALVVYPARQFVHTDRDVMIVTEASRAKAAGLEADLPSGSMKLFSSGRQRVSIVVEPNSINR